MMSPAKVHFKLKVKGSPEKVVKFHQLLKFKDNDYPYSRMKFGFSVNPILCEKCGGLEWSRPSVTPSQIKAAAKQVGLRKVSIQHYALPCSK